MTGEILNRIDRATTDDIAAIIHRVARRAFYEGATYQRTMNPTDNSLRAKAVQTGDDYGSKARAGLLHAILALDLEPAGGEDNAV